MIRQIFLLFVVLPFIAFSQNKQKPVRLTETEFNRFPDQFDVTQKVFEYYYDIGYIHKNADSLNDAQKVLFYHFICDGIIDNSGFYSILLETGGEFNSGYSKALELIGDTAGRKIVDEIASIYNKYEKWFSKGNNPPVLVEDSKEFDKKLYDRIEELQQKWSANDVKREILFKDYLSRNKADLVRKD